MPRKVVFRWRPYGASTAVSLQLIIFVSGFCGEPRGSPSTGNDVKLMAAGRVQTYFQNQAARVQPPDVLGPRILQGLISISQPPATSAGELYVAPWTLILATHRPFGFHRAINRRVLRSSRLLLLTVVIHRLLLG